MSQPPDTTAAVPDSMRAPAIVNASEGDRDAVVAILAAASLPHADLGAGTLVELFVARDGAAIVGAIGLERHGSTGLLRSLVVGPQSRGQGLGAALVRYVERHAQGLGLDALVLLTETAAPFFAQRGYRRIERHEAPLAVRQSEEFRSLCPAAAVCMLKSLTDGCVR